MSEQGQRVTVSERDGVHVVSFADKKILDEMSITEIGQQLGGIVAGADKPSLVLDFSKVSHMSSSALGMLITLHKRVREKGGSLRLAAIEPKIYEVFVITRLNEISDIHGTVEAAVAASA
jgi:anti-sigma B factor antagonist